MITEQKLRQLAAGTIFRAVFRKKDGSMRTMVCRLGVKSHLSPTSQGLTEAQKKADIVNEQVRVFDMHKKQYRKINLKTLVSLRIKGKDYEITNKT